MIRDLPNIGIYSYKFASHELQSIRDEINEIKSNFDNYSSDKMNSELAGNIKREYELHKSKQHIRNLVLPHLVEYHKSSNILGRHKILSQDIPVELDKVWVNFQRKGEFNPPHKHSGIASFVIYLNIPFLIQDEKTNVSSVNSNTNVAGNFYFSYTDITGQICIETLEVDKNWENTILIFPSNMIHGVHPFFSSDDYRISVAGNFNLKI
jgi:hypothetical protein